MTVPQTDATTDPHSIIAKLRAERDAALAREAKLDSDYAERAAHQGATVEVLQAMAASPGEPEPVFEVIVRRARDLCDAYSASLARLVDGSIVLRAYCVPNEAEAKGHEASFPRPVAADTMFGRAILAREPVQLPDVAADQAYALREGTLRGAVRAQAAVPLMRDGEAIGAINMTRRQTGEFSQAQIELLQVFANQAVIAINSAETYRALRERTAALATRNSEYGERIEHQAATIDVLKVMSASPGDPQPAFELIVRRARELCNSAGAGIAEYDGVLVHQRSLYGDSSGFSAEYIASFPMRPTRGSIPCRAILDKRIIHIRNTDVEPELLPIVRHLGVRSVLSIPLLRDGAAIGAFTIHANQSGGFSDSQVALLQTFAEQAVIAITSAETYRALQTRTSDLQETLEYQTATSDVLKVISRSTFDLQPVLAMVAETAARLCVADQAAIYLVQDDMVRLGTNFGFPPEYEARMNEILPLPVAPVGTNAQTVLHRAIIERSVIHIPDVASVLGYPDAPIRLGRQRTSLGVPLLRDGEPVGLILLARQRVEPFTERQIELVSTFADQAVIAIENTRLITEQREALEQQTATAEVLEVINSSPGDLGPVFQALLRKAHTLCEASFGALMTYDGERFHAVAHQGTPAPFREFLGSGLLPGPGDPFGLMVEGAAYSHIHDLLEVVARYPGEPLPRAAADLGGIRTLLVVPLRKDSELLGVITAYRQETRPFSDRQIALLQNFAAQAVIAMDNARLITETREALEQQTATAEVLQVINASPGNLAPVFDAMLEKAIRLCEAEFGTLRTWDGERFHLGAAHGDPELIEWTKRQRPFTPINGNFPLGRIVRGAEVVRITDALLASYETTSGFGAMAAAIGFRSGIAVALRKDATLLGAISVYRKNEVRPFTDKQIALLQSFAAQAVIAMENARLLDEIRQRQEELRVTFENMGDGVAMFDETQYLAAWNRKFQDILDLPDALLEQRRTYEEHLRFLAARGDFGPGVDTVEQIEELVASTGQPYGYERTRPDGRVIEIRRNPVPDGGFVLIYSDITERKRSEEEIRAARDAAETALRELKIAQANLIQAEKMASLGQLTAGIAHEIKNPLNFVNNFAALSVDLLGELKETAAPGFAALTDKQRAEVEEVSVMLTSNLEKITEHGKRADGIVKAMLEHSRGSSGERRMVDLNTLIDEALNLAYHGARAQDQSFNITLERDFDEGIAPIEVNPQDITRVFLNLFANSFYATTKRARDGGDTGFVPTLKVITRDAGEAVEIRVRDNGIGIPADIRDKLFQPFFTTKPTGEGTGLGLSITYDIVTQQHGGSIAVDSKVDDYSEFTIRLPRKP